MRRIEKRTSCLDPAHGAHSRSNWVWIRPIRHAILDLDQLSKKRARLIWKGSAPGSLLTRATQLRATARKDAQQRRPTRLRPADGHGTLFIAIEWGPTRGTGLLLPTITGQACRECRPPPT
jgi:hypothetical protein